MYWSKIPKLDPEFFSKLNPIGFILGLLIGTILLLALFGVFRERKVISIMSKIVTIILSMFYVSIFIMFFYMNQTILGKIIVSALFVLVLFFIYRKNRINRAKKKVHQ